jgi:hypothetical protein
LERGRARRYNVPGMGASGPGLFSDDLAADIRDLYMDALREGVSDREATDRILADWREAVEGTGEADVFWFALASTQARVGRLDDLVKANALAALDRGTDLAKWQHQHPDLAGRRARVLDHVRGALVGPQRDRVVIKPKRPPARARFTEGDVLRYALADGRSLLLRVVRAYDAQNIVFDVLLWIGTVIPDEAGIRTVLSHMPSIGPATAIRDERRFWALGVFKPVRDHVTLVGRVSWHDPEPEGLNVTYTTWEALPHSVWRSIEAYQGGPEPQPSLAPVAPWQWGVIREGRLLAWDD